MPFDAQFDEKQSPLLVNAALNYFDLSSKSEYYMYWLMVLNQHQPYAIQE